MRAQKTNATLQSEVDALRKENVTLKLQLKSQKDGTSLTPAEDDTKRLITRWAKFFQLFYSAALTVDSIKSTKPNFAHDDPERYQGDNAKLGPTAELYAIVPQKYITFMVQFESLAKHVSESIKCQIYVTSDYLQFHA